MSSPCEIVAVTAHAIYVHILNGTYKFCNFNNVKQFILFKKPYALSIYTNHGCRPPAISTDRAGNYFTTNRMASCPPQIKLLCTCLHVGTCTNMYSCSSDLQHKMCSKRIDMYTLQMEAASVVVFPFVQCGLVAPLVVDGSPDSVSPLVEWGLKVSQVGG